jgi:TolB protein
MSSDGSDQQQLTSDHENRAPAWSPDGRSIAFISNRTGSDQLFIDGGSQKRLTSTGFNYDPVWSPDGRRIAFVSNRDTAEQIYVMNADGSQQTRLIAGERGLDEAGAAWSPDGRRIAYASKDPS